MTRISKMGTVPDSFKMKCKNGDCPHFIRTFTSIELSYELKQALSKIIDVCKQTQADVKWVKPENIHITLKFLGGITEEQIELVKKQLSNIAMAINSFYMELRGAGTFPEKRIPRIIWIGIDKGKEDLIKCVDLIEKSLCKIGFKKEDRIFTPHITIGRVRSPKNVPLLKNKLNEYENISFGNCLAKEMTLMKSELSREGSTYTAIAKFSFIG